MSVNLKALNTVLTKSIFNILKQATSSAGRNMADKPVNAQIDKAIEDLEESYKKEIEKQEPKPKPDNIIEDSIVEDS